jgi:hypothetical protein
VLGACGPSRVARNVGWPAYPAGGVDLVACCEPARLVEVDGWSSAQPSEVQAWGYRAAVIQEDRSTDGR